MRTLSLPSVAVVVFLLGLLQGIPSSEGFSSKTAKRTKKTVVLDAPSIFYHPVAPSRAPLTTLKSESSHHYYLQAREPSQVLHLWNSQKVVLWASLVLAIAAAATQTVSWQTLRRNILAGTAIFMVGDYAAQLLTHFTTPNRSRLFSLDKNRFVISFALGILWAGICNPYVYSGVEYFFPGAGNVGRVLLKMAVSISILSTAGNYATMLFRRFFKQLLETKCSQPFHSLKTCIQSCNHDFLEVLRDDLKVWPLYDFVCYSVIPPSVRPITNALMASVWSMYMSIASAKSSATPVEY